MDEKAIRAAAEKAAKECARYICWENMAAIIEQALRDAIALDREERGTRAGYHRVPATWEERESMSLAAKLERHKISVKYNQYTKQWESELNYKLYSGRTPEAAVDAALAEAEGKEE